MKTIEVKLDERKVEISKLPIGKYAELLKAIKELPKHIKGLDQKNNEAIFEMLPSLIGESLPDFIDMLTIATPLKKEEIEVLGLDEVTRLILAVIEVNNFKEVYGNIKKALARPEAVAVK
jgi:hypothetical protein